MWEGSLRSPRFAIRTSLPADPLASLIDMPRNLSARPRRTPRLELRPFRRRDVDALIEGVKDSLTDLERWLPWVHRRYGRADALRFIRDSSAAWVEGRAHDFAIRFKERPDHHVGNISIWPTSQRERSGEMGYWIRTSETGAGIASEAGARVLQLGFEELGLHRVTLRIAVGNLRSERVAEKLGFVHEGLLRKEVLVKGEWLDHTLWAILDEEYGVLKEEWVAQEWLEG
jgi:RimJ/RimL family protein N-acetyltransferase